MLEYLYQALRSERGVVVRASDRDRLRAKLYSERADAADPDLACLSFIPSVTAPDELLIVKRSTPDAPA